MAGGINAIANLLGKVDANNALLVAISGGSGSFSALTVDTLTFDIANPDTVLVRDAASGTLALKNGAAQQTFRVYGDTDSWVSLTDDGVNGYIGAVGTAATLYATSAAGLMVLANNGLTDFSRLMFGGTDATFPALRRSGTNVDVVLADVSAYAPFRAKMLSFSDTGDLQLYGGANTPEGAITAPIGSIFMRTNGTAATTLYVKTSGTGNTGWQALAIP